MLPRELNLQGVFADVSYEEWKAAAEADLKGVPFEKKLIAHLYDNVEIQPLYTASDWPSEGDPSGFPGFVPFTRGSQPLSQALWGWSVGREILQADPAEANKTIKEELHGGATLLDLKLDAAGCMGLDGDAAQASGWRGQQGVMIYSSGDLAETLATVDPATTFISLHAGSAFLPAAAMLGAWHLLPGSSIHRLQLSLAQPSLHRHWFCAWRRAYPSLGEGQISFEHGHSSGKHSGRRGMVPSVGDCTKTSVVQILTACKCRIHPGPNFSEGALHQKQSQRIRGLTEPVFCTK